MSSSMNCAGEPGQSSPTLSPKTMKRTKCSNDSTSRPRFHRSFAPSAQQDGDDLLDLLRVWLTVADEGPAVPTVRQVAAAYGGSRSTVARMLSEIGAIGRSTALSETDLGQER